MKSLDPILHICGWVLAWVERNICSTLLPQLTPPFPFPLVQGASLCCDEVCPVKSGSRYSYGFASGLLCVAANPARRKVGRLCERHGGTAQERSAGFHMGELQQRFKVTRVHVSHVQIHRVPNEHARHGLSQASSSSRAAAVGFLCSRIQRQTVSVLNSIILRQPWLFFWIIFSRFLILIFCGLPSNNENFWSFDQDSNCFDQSFGCWKHV